MLFRNMLIKKNIELPTDFFPTRKQARRIKNGCLVRRCQNCGNYFTTKLGNQFYCSVCYRIKGRVAPDLKFKELKELY